MSTQNTEPERIDWEDVIVKLQTFTRSLVKRKKWFRGSKTSMFLSGKEIDDYVYGAIETYLRNPEKFDPSKGSLVDYLNYNLVRSLVSRDVVSAENKTSDDVFGTAERYKEEEDDHSGSYLDRTLPFASALFDQELDYKEIMEFVENEVKDDPMVENIFLALSTFGMKRREVIKEFNMTEKEYDNGMRRLKTILSNAATRYDLKTNRNE